MRMDVFHFSKLRVRRPEWHCNAFNCNFPFLLIEWNTIKREKERGRTGVTRSLHMCAVVCGSIFHLNGSWWCNCSNMHYIFVFDIFLEYFCCSSFCSLQFSLSHCPFRSLGLSFSGFSETRCCRFTSIFGAFYIPQNSAFLSRKFYSTTAAMATWPNSMPFGICELRKRNFNYHSSRTNHRGECNVQLLVLVAWRIESPFHGNSIVLFAWIGFACILCMQRVACRMFDRILTNDWNPLSRSIVCMQHSVCVVGTKRATNALQIESVYTIDDDFWFHRTLARHQQ